jgi:toxin CptA
MDARQQEHKYSDATVFLPLAPSRAGVACVAMAAMATLALIAATPGFDAARILAATAVVCAALEAAHSQALLRGRRAAHELRIRGTAIEVCDGLGCWRTGAVRAGSFVAPWLTIVRWRPEGARLDRSVPILPGMAPPAEFRRLRVVLKWA